MVLAAYDVRREAYRAGLALAEERLVLSRISRRVGARRSAIFSSLSYDPRGAQNWRTEEPDPEEMAAGGVKAKVAAEKTEI